MNRILALACAMIACAISSAHSQAPIAPPAAAGAANTPAAVARQQLETIREQNAKLLEQQTRTLQLLDEMEKASQTLKTLGKRA